MARETWFLTSNASFANAEPGGREHSVTIRPSVCAVAALALLASVAPACLAQPVARGDEARARELTRQGDYEGAAAEYAALDSETRLDWRVRADWGTVLVWAGRYGEAAAQLERAYGEAPRAKPASLTRAYAVALAGGGDPTRGLELARTALLPTKSEPESRQALIGVATLLEERGARAAADDNWVEARGLALGVRSLRCEWVLRKPNSDTKDQDRAVRLAESKDYAGALAIYEMLERTGKLDWRACGDWGIALSWAGKPFEAAGRLDVALELSPQPVPEYLPRALAAALASAGETERSWELVTRYLLPNRAKADTQSDLASIADRLDEQAARAAARGDDARSDALHERASSIRPAGRKPAPASQTAEAVALARSGQIDEALRVFEALEARGALDWKGRADWGIVLSWAERHAEALTQLRQAEAGGPTPTPDYVTRALITALAGSGQWEPAWSRIETALLPKADDPEVAESLRVISLLYFEAGSKLAGDASARDDEQGLMRAIWMLECAGRLHAADPRYPAELGRALVWSNQYDRAVEVLSALSPTKPEEAYIAATLGEAEEGRNRREEALAAFQRALALDPANEQALGGLTRYADALDREGMEDARVAEDLKAKGDAATAAPLFASAEAKLLRATDLAPGLARLWADLGIARNWAGKPAEALTALETALHLLGDPRAPYHEAELPPYAHVLAAYAAALQGVGRDEEATTLLEDLAASEPLLPGVQSAMVGPAREASARGIEHAKRAVDVGGAATPDETEKAAALAEFSHALELAPDAWQVLADVGIGENWLAMHSEAKTHLGRALELAPAPQPAYILDAMIRAHAGLGEWDAGLALAERSLARGGEGREAILGARDALVQRYTDTILAAWDAGDREALLAELRRLSQRVPDSPQLLVDLGVLIVRAANETADPPVSMWVEAQGLLEDGSRALGERTPDYALAALAGAHAHQGHLDQALEALERLEAIHPNHPSAAGVRELLAGQLSAEGIALARQGQTDAGVAKIQHGLEIAPTSWRVLADLGIVLLWEGDADRAVEVLERATTGAGDQAPTYLLRALGDAYLGQGRYGDADRAYEQALALDPADPFTRNAILRIPRGMGERALQAAWKGDLDEAKRLCDEALVAFPDDAWVQVDAGIVASWDQRSAEAVETLAQWLPRIPLAPVLGYTALSDAYLDLGQPENAAAVWERLPPDYPDAATAATLRARAAERILQLAREYAKDMGSMRRAEQLYRRAALLDPANWRTLADLAILLMRQERFVEAEQTLHLARTVAEAPSGYITRTLGDILALTDRPQEAMEYYREAIRQNDTDWSAQLGMIRCLAWSKREREALTALEAYLAADPEDVRALAARAYVFAVAGCYGEAIRDYDHALAIKPTDDGLRVAKAQALRWAGKPDQAYALLQDVLRGNPNDMDALVQIVGVGLDSNRPKQASDAYERLTKVLPEDSPTLERFEWTLRPYRDPSIAAEFSSSIDTDRVSTLLAGVVLRWPVTPRLRVELRDRMRWIREPNVIGTDWNAVGASLEWQASPSLRLSGSVDWNRLSNLGSYSPTTYELRADIRANDRVDLRASYRHSLLTATRALLDRTSGHEVSAGMTYRPDTKTRWDLDYSRMAVSDGNTRSWTSVAWNRQVRRSGTHWATFGLEARRLANSAPSTRYWSPTRYDVLMARYTIGEDNADKGVWWSLGFGAGVSYDSQAGFGVPVSISASLRKRLGSDSLLEVGAGVSTAGTERTSPGRSAYGMGWWYISYRHFF